MGFRPLPAVLCLSLLSCALAGTCRASELKAGPTSDRGSVARTYLDKKLSLWQSRLKLQEWTIKIVISTPADLRSGTLGNIHWDPEKKTAVIHVLDASAYDTPLDATLHDMEFTVVHELIHLEFSASTRPDAASRTEEEFAVNRIAEALVQLDRNQLDHKD